MGCNIIEPTSHLVPFLPPPPPPSRLLVFLSALILAFHHFCHATLHDNVLPILSTISSYLLQHNTFRQNGFSRSRSHQELVVLYGSFCPSIPKFCLRLRAFACFASGASHQAPIFVCRRIGFEVEGKKQRPEQLHHTWPSQ